MNILIKPLITEKMTVQGQKLNNFGFIVDKRANKLQIKKAIQDLYGVTVQDINTMVYSGKKKARNTKAGMIVGRTNAYKKAIVTLKQGETIDFYSNI
ncbi:MAG: 50S ribosomal protein L23 [Bacteroidetes bacterium ADurb.Bin408]|mgnify:CR=1 FL=1|nr:MAG: 50S ribosomal protein L23 [Bacteroidetes bacterium ADurb.Bin408]